MEQNLYKDREGKLYGKGHMKDLRVDGRIQLKWVFKKYVVKRWTKFICLRMGDQWQAVVPTAMNLLIS
jgi:hypothetical protein